MADRLQKARDLLASRVPVSEPEYRQMLYALIDELAQTRQERDTEADAVTAQRETIKKLRSDRRERIATSVLGSFIANPRLWDSHTTENAADAAVQYADALIKRLGA